MARGGIRSTSFKKGKSGNPGGRPKELVNLREIARTHTKESVERLVHWMRSDDARASVAAADKLIDRGWGKSAQPVTGEGGEGPIKTDNTVTIKLVRPPDANR